MSDPEQREAILMNFPYASHCGLKHNPLYCCVYADTASFSLSLSFSSRLLCLTISSSLSFSCSHSSSVFFLPPSPLSLSLSHSPGLDIVHVLSAVNLCWCRMIYRWSCVNIKYEMEYSDGTIWEDLCLCAVQSVAVVIYSPSSLTTAKAYGSDDMRLGICFDRS